MNAASRILPTIGWGIFCAASWTWCIGMFLPLILLRDDGWRGFVAFAVPNVLGCAAFGYLMSRAACRRALSRDARFVRLFSIATVAFQLFFVGFVLTALSPWRVSPTAVGLLVLLVGAGLGGHRAGTAWAPSAGVDRGRVPWPALMLLGVVTWIISMAVFALIGIGGWSDFGATGQLAPIEVVWILPVLTFGFLLCPYLDGTFHVARLRAPSRHAFAVFGVTFALMLLLSAAYSSTLLRHGLTWLILLHMLVQLTFTVAVHIRVVNDLRPRAATVGLPWIVWIAAPLVGSWLVPDTAFGIDAVHGEAWYLRWLALWGLLFPAIVLMLRSPASADPTRRALPMAIVIVVGLLLCEVGFIHGQRWLLPIPIALALLTALWPQRRPHAIATLPSASA